MNSKVKFGQFYTTNSDYILEGFDVPKDRGFIEPFVGNGDLLVWLKKRGIDEVETYDIDPKIKCKEIRDSLMNPPIYFDKYIVTNPPYLLKNKTKDKKIYKKYDTDDLYKATIISIIDGDIYGGILIIPVNFLCGDDSKVKKMFFEKYKITKCKIFEESVFDDTTYSVMAIQFEKCENKIEHELEIEFLPSMSKMKIKIEKKHNWKLAQYLFESENKTHNIGRLLIGQTPTTNLKLYTIDSGSMEGRIRLVYDENHYYGKNTDRTVATISTIKPIEDEKKLAEEFNKKLEFYRDKYRSLFLSTYRNSTENYMRKRMSFRQAYSFIENIIDKKL